MCRMAIVTLTLSTYASMFRTFQNSQKEIFESYSEICSYSMVLNDVDKEQEFNVRVRGLELENHLLIQYFREIQNCLLSSPGVKKLL